jgi:uncharacterized Zn-finger protein
MQPPETSFVGEETVACDGGDGAFGHPRVFLNMEGAGHVLCPYCGHDFVLKNGAKTNAGH